MRSPLVLALALVLASMPALAVAEVPPHVKAKLEQDKDERAALKAKLGDALKAADKEAIAALFGAEVQLKGLWFASASCHKRFGGRVVAKAADAADLAACMTELGLKQNKDGYFAHEPGVTWFMIWKDGKLTSISNLEIDPTSPSIERDILRKHAKTKLDVKRDAKTRAMMKKDPELLVFVDVRMCIDAKGKVDALEAKSEPAFESYRAAVEAAAKKWRFKPFKHAGKPIRVCATHFVEQFDGGGVLGGVMGGAIDEPEPPPPLPPPPVKTAKKW